MARNEQTKPVATPEPNPTPAATPPAGERKSFTLHFAGSRGRVAHVSAFNTGKGAVSVVFIDSKNPETGKKERQRGATTKHPSLDAAKAAVEQLGKDMVAKGWQPKKGTGGGGSRRPDSFSAADLPSAE